MENSPVSQRSMCTVKPSGYSEIFHLSYMVASVSYSKQINYLRVFPYIWVFMNTVNVNSNQKA